MKGQALVIGGGPNGLAAATVLARAGRRVTVLERREGFGGLAAGYEFHPGFKTTGVVHDDGILRAEVASALELERHGLKRRGTPACLALEADGPGILLSRDVARTAEAIAGRSSADAESYKKWRAFLSRIKGFVERVMSEAPPELEPRRAGQLLDLLKTGVSLRRLGEGDMLELLRVGPMCVGDWMKDTFETERLRAALALPGVLGTWLGPWSAGSAALLMARESTATDVTVGGAAGIAEALERAARAAGATLRSGVRVERVLVDKETARGVTLEGGETLEADAVVSTIEPRHLFMDLVPRRELPLPLEDEVHGWRTRGTSAKVHLALDAPLDAPGHDGPLERFSTGESLDAIEQAFDAVKYHRASERPVLDVHVPTVAQPELAREGKHVASVLVHYTPHELEGGWTDAARTALERSVLDALDAVLPGTSGKVIGTETLTPRDLEERYELPGGQLHHGEHSLDQLLFLRPAPSCARYSTPIAGLFLAGSGSHPGGGAPGAAGVLGARRTLEAR